MTSSGHARRLSSSSSQHRPSSRDGPQYFLLEHGSRQNNNNNAPATANTSGVTSHAANVSKSDDSEFDRLRAIRQATHQQQQQQQQQQLQHQRSAPGSSRSASQQTPTKPNIAPKPSLKATVSASQPPHAASQAAGRPVTSSSRSRPELSSGEGLDEDEVDGSWNEITLRPTRFNAASRVRNGSNVNDVRTENKTGKTSWP